MNAEKFLMLFVAAGLLVISSAAVAAFGCAVYHLVVAMLRELPDTERLHGSHQPKDPAPPNPGRTPTQWNPDLFRTHTEGETQ